MALIFSIVGGVDLLRAALEGKKTETRRLGARRWIVGRSYAVKARRTAPGFCRAVVTAVRQERLTEIDQDAVSREGLDCTPDEFCQIFRQLHGLEPSADPLVWVIQFRMLRFTRGLTTESPYQCIRQGESLEAWLMR